MNKQQTVRFPKDNKINYGQDMGFHRGVPSDVDFEIEEFTDDRVRLIADGYGVLGKGGNKYGNGSIYVNKKDMKLIKEKEISSGCPKCKKRNISSNELIKGAKKYLASFTKKEWEIRLRQEEIKYNKEKIKELKSTIKGLDEIIFVRDEKISNLRLEVRELQEDVERLKLVASGKVEVVVDKNGFNRSVYIGGRRYPFTYKKLVDEYGNKNINIYVEEVDNG